MKFGLKLIECQFHFMLYCVIWFVGLRCRFGRHRADVHRTSCALAFSLTRVRKHWWDDI